MPKPHSPSCERNQKPILQILKKIITKNHKNLFEIGSGTGQHAVFMAPEFPHLTWQTSDLPENHAGIQLWLNDACVENVLLPLHYQAGETAWPDSAFDLVFSANSLHIMSWSECCCLFADLSNLSAGSKVIFYGPFNYNGDYTSQSNAEFDVWLKQRHPQSAIRDFEKVLEQMTNSSFEIMQDNKMPANNRLLVFQKN